MRPAAISATISAVGEIDATFSRGSIDWGVTTESIEMKSVYAPSPTEPASIACGPKALF
jgi:hypothetical protein